MAKISIIGCGAVGAVSALILSESEWIEEIVLVDIDKTRSQGNALDVMHGVPLLSHPVNVIAGDYEQTAHSDVVVITVGVPEVVGESRLIPLQKNTDILKQLVPDVVKYSPKAILLVVSNPVDILSYVTYRLAGLPEHQIIGLGTMLDTSRLRYLLSRDFGVSPENINSYVIGEHGDSQVILWSKTTINSLPIMDYAHLVDKKLPDSYFTDLAKEVRETAFDVWEMKGPNAFCVAIAIKRVIKTIVGNERTILPVSSYLKLSDKANDDIYVSLPSLLSRRGVETTYQLPLREQEKEKYCQSLSLLKKLANELDIHRGKQHESQ